MKILILFVILFSFQVFAHDKKPAADPKSSNANSSAPIKAKVLYDGNDLDGGNINADKNSVRTPNGQDELPFPDEDSKHSDPGVNSNKNMPIDQD